MLQLQITNCRRDDVEIINDLLDDTMALSVTLTDQHDDPILEPELGTVPLWPKVVIEALYADVASLTTAKNLLANFYPDLTFKTDILPEQDWQRVCLEHFKPQQFAEHFWICPSWSTIPDPNAVNLILDPGLAFGTGTHPTTSLCLTWLAQAELNNKTVIDYGCGSGILALAALKLGAAHAFAVDIDVQALQATQSNATNNNIPSTQLDVDFPDKLTIPVDVLLANILLKPLLALKKQFVTLLKPKGLLVLSGVLETQLVTLQTAYGTDFTLISTLQQDDWGLLVLQKN